VGRLSACCSHSSGPGWDTRGWLRPGLRVQAWTLTLEWGEVDNPDTYAYNKSGIAYQDQSRHPEAIVSHKSEPTTTKLTTAPFNRVAAGRWLVSAAAFRARHIDVVDGALPVPLPSRCRH
jgi:hypothetical protein